MLAPVDRVEVTIGIDNFVDVLMAGEEGVARYPGWRAVHAFARAMPEAFVQPAVGTTVTF